MSLWMINSKDVDMVPLQGEINSKEEERLWLEEKRWWISSKREDLELDDSRKPKSKCEETTKRPNRLFQQHYSRKNKDTTSVPSPSSDAPLNDITMPSDDSFRIDSEVQNSSPLTSKSNALNHHATIEITWLRILLSELGFGPKKPMVLFCDNTTAIEITNNLV